MEKRGKKGGVGLRTVSQRNNIKDEARALAKKERPVLEKGVPREYWTGGRRRGGSRALSCLE